MFARVKYVRDKEVCDVPVSFIKNFNPGNFSKSRAYWCFWSQKDGIDSPTAMLKLVSEIPTYNEDLVPTLNIDYDLFACAGYHKATILAVGETSEDLRKKVDSKRVSSVPAKLISLSFDHGTKTNKRNKQSKSNFKSKAANAPLSNAAGPVATSSKASVAATLLQARAYNLNLLGLQMDKDDCDSDLCDELPWDGDLPLDVQLEEFGTNAKQENNAGTSDVIKKQVKKEQQQVNIEQVKSNEKSKGNSLEHKKKAQEKQERNEMLLKKDKEEKKPNKKAREEKEKKANDKERAAKEKKRAIEKKNAKEEKEQKLKQKKEQKLKEEKELKAKDEKDKKTREEKSASEEKKKIKEEETKKAKEEKDKKTREEKSANEKKKIKEDKAKKSIEVKKPKEEKKKTKDENVNAIANEAEKHKNAKEEQVQGGEGTGKTLLLEDETRQIEPLLIDKVNIDEELTEEEKSKKENDTENANGKTEDNSEEENETEKRKNRSNSEEEGTEGRKREKEEETGGKKSGEEQQTDTSEESSDEEDTTAEKSSEGGKKSGEEQQTDTSEKSSEEEDTTEEKSSEETLKNEDEKSPMEVDNTPRLRKESFTLFGGDCQNPHTHPLSSSDSDGKANNRLSRPTKRLLSDGRRDYGSNKRSKSAPRKRRLSEDSNSEADPTIISPSKYRALELRCRQAEAQNFRLRQLNERLQSSLMDALHKRDKTYQVSTSSSAQQKSQQLSAANKRVPSSGKKPPRAVPNSVALKKSLPAPALESPSANSDEEDLPDNAGAHLDSADEGNKDHDDAAISPGDVNDNEVYELCPGRVIRGKQLRDFWNTKTGPDGDSLFVKNTAHFLWGPLHLKTHSVRGRRVKRKDKSGNEEVIHHPALDSAGMQAVKDFLNERLRREGLRDGDPQHEDRCNQTRLNRFINDKIKTVRSGQLD